MTTSRMIECTRGHLHYGARGAAGALLVAPGVHGPRLLLALRSRNVHHGGTWSVPGGALEPHENAWQAACREFHEEVHVSIDELAVDAVHDFECGGWHYTTLIVGAPYPAVMTSPYGWETEDVRWFDPAEIDNYALADDVLHPAFATSWPQLRDAIAANPALGMRAGVR